MALELAAQGARLALTDIDTAGGRELCDLIRTKFDGKVDVVFASLDVVEHEAAGKLMRTFKKTYKRLDGLVNCAGMLVLAGFDCGQI